MHRTVAWKVWRKRPPLRLQLVWGEDTDFKEVAGRGCALLCVRWRTQWTPYHINSCHSLRYLLSSPTQLNTRLNVTFPYASQSSKFTIPVKLPLLKFVCIPHLPHLSHIPCSSILTRRYLAKAKGDVQAYRSPSSMLGSSLYRKSIILSSSVLLYFNTCSLCWLWASRQM